MNAKDSINKFSKIKVLVVGDVMLDHYVFGEVERISPEAPIPILKKNDEKFVPGGAGNVASNLASLGVKVSIAGIVGNDYIKDFLKKIFKEKKINSNALYTRKNKPSILKERLVAKNQQLLRVDQEETSYLLSSEEKEFFSLIKKQIFLCNGIIFSDYNKGCFSPSLVKNIIKTAKISKKPIFADIKPENKVLFKGVEIIKPNAKEAIEMTGEKDVDRAGDRLAKYYQTNIVVTQGEKGLTIFKKNGKKIPIPGKKITLNDVSGAGDTTIAVLAICILSGLDIETAGLVANHAGSIVVQKPGTATITVEELESSLQKDYHLEEIGMVPKIWGYEKWLENNENYCCKLLSLNKGFQCSLHYHKEKDEMFFVTKGHVRLEVNGKVMHMREGNFMRIKPGTKHRFRGMEDSIIIEVSTHHEEHDSHRIEKSKGIDLV